MTRKMIERGVLFRHFADIVIRCNLAFWLLSSAALRDGEGLKTRREKTEELNCNRGPAALAQPSSRTKLL
jgi:hypothetical protein